MPRSSQRECVDRFDGEIKGGECEEASIGESLAKCSTPTICSPSAFCGSVDAG
jgi:hypothetical protein